MKKILTKTSILLTMVNEKINHFFDYVLKHFGFIIMLVFVSTVAILIRYAVVDILSGDSYWFLVPWTRYIRDNGGLSSLNTIPISYFQTAGGVNIPYGIETNLTITGEIRGNYPTFYYVLIALFSYLPISELAVIKTISFIFDFSAALAVFFIIKHLSKNNKLLMLVSFSLSLFLPTVFINSAIWGQCDAFFAGMGLWFIYFLLKEKPTLATLFLGIGFTIKIHMAFMLPLIGILFLRKKYNLFNLLLIPVVVFISFIPSYLFGASFKMPFEQLFNVALTYSAPNMNSGSFYAFFQGINGNTLWREAVKNFGVIFALFVLLLVTYVLYEMKIKIDECTLILLATLFSFLSPFVLPYMHERYFFMGDLFIILYIVIKRKRFYLLFVSQAASLITYANFILGGWIFKSLDATGNLAIAASLNIFIMATILIDLYKSPKIEPILIEKSENIQKE